MKITELNEDDYLELLTYIITLLAKVCNDNVDSFEVVRFKPSQFGEMKVLGLFKGLAIATNFLDKKIDKIIIKMGIGYDSNMDDWAYTLYPVQPAITFLLHNHINYVVNTTLKISDVFTESGSKTNCPSMLCSDHWRLLIDEIERQEMGHYISETNLETTKRYFNRGSFGLSIKNFEPLSQSLDMMTAVGVGLDPDLIQSEMKKETLPCIVCLMGADNINMSVRKMREILAKISDSEIIQEGGIQ